MNKTFKIFKAMATNDMQLFKFKSKKNTSKLKKMLLPVILFMIVAASIGVYVYEIAKPLSKVGLTYVSLTMFLLLASLITFIQGIYKSQGILFDGKDNDLLFSLPIKKSTIFSLRIIKLLTYQFIYNLMYILPALVVYIYLEKPNISFYPISLLMIILLPIIPTLIASIIGYFVKLLSSKSKSKKFIQSILSAVVFFVIWLLLMRFEDFIKDIVKNATSINDFITKLYYPIGLYINLITKFKLLDLVKLLLINILPYYLVVKIASIKYFNIVSDSHEVTVKNKKSNKKITYKQNNKIITLTKKDLTKYITSPIYVMNTIFALLIILIGTIAFTFNPNQVLKTVMNGNISKTISITKYLKYFPYIYSILIIFSSMTTSITSSSISIEKKTFNITKSLPVSEEDIFKSKILFGNIISIPIILLSTLIFIIKFKISIINSILLIFLALFTPTLSSLAGLLINLIFPKMNAQSDAEIVKQGASSMIAVWTGMIVTALFSFPIIYNLNSNRILLIFVLETSVIIILDLIIWYILKTYGKKLYQKIEI